MGLTVYMEGGGNNKSSKNKLRIGMTEFLVVLKDELIKKGSNLKIVACGPRNKAYKLFVSFKPDSKYSIAILLVDSEEQVNGKPPFEYLKRRDRWEKLNEKDKVHLMVQTMETWLISDPQALEKYYGHNFHRKSLSNHQNLEKVSKETIYKSLTKATENTSKGEYHKIDHASELLKVIDSGKVRERCPHCDLLFTDLLTEINKL